MSATITSNAGGIKRSGVTIENEPIVRSDGSGEVMQWQPSDEGTDGVFINQHSLVGHLQLGVGISPATEGHPFEVGGTTGASCGMGFVNTDAVMSDDEQIARIAFKSLDTHLDTDHQTVAKIVVRAAEDYDASDDNASDMEFYTSASSEIVNTSTTPDLILSSGGNLGVGVSPVSSSGISRFLHIGGATAGVVLEDTDGPNKWENYSAGGNLKWEYNGGSSALTISSAGNVGVGVVPDSKLDVFTTSYNNIRIGEDKDNQSTQRGGILAQPYLTAEQATAGMLMYIDGTGATQDTANLQIGGGHGSYNAVKQISFYTAANATTTTGTERLSINSAGKAEITATGNGDWALKAANTHANGSGALIVAGGSASTDVALEVKHSTNTTALKIDGTGLTTVSAITETNGVLRSNLLTNSGFDVWSNSTLENTGSDLIDNGDFASASDWGVSTGAWVIGSGVATFTTGSGTSILSQGSLGTTSGKLYKLTFTVGTATATIAITNASASGTLVAEADYAVGAHTVVYEDVGNNDIAFTSSGGNSYTLDNVSLYEGVPGCIAGAGTTAFDGWWKTNAGLSIYRQHNDGGTYTKDGSFYALKTTTTGTAKVVAWPNTTVRSLPEHYQRFNGRKVTFGCWAKTTTANHIRLQIDDGGTPLSSSYVNNDGNWHWLELTDTIDAAGSQAWFKIAFDATSADAYISQPMLVFGSAIGSGNYSRPSGEVIWCETGITTQQNLSPAATDDKILNLEALSSGKVPKGATAIDMRVSVRNSSVVSGKGVEYGAESTFTDWLAALPMVNNFTTHAVGWVDCDSNGDIYQKVGVTGSTLAGLYNTVKAIQLR